MAQEKYQRFLPVYREGSAFSSDGTQYIIVDQTTGVNYLVVQMGNGTGVTPLYDADGKIIVTK